jgi:hypothetical protein
VPVTDASQLWHRCFLVSSCWKGGTSGSGGLLDSGTDETQLGCLCPVILGRVNKSLPRPIDPDRPTFNPVPCSLGLPPQIPYVCHSEFYTIFPFFFSNMKSLLGDRSCRCMTPLRMAQPALHMGLTRPKSHAPSAAMCHLLPSLRHPTGPHPNTASTARRRAVEAFGPAFALSHSSIIFFSNGSG